MRGCSVLSYAAAWLAADREFITGYDRLKLESELYNMQEHPLQEHNLIL